MYLIAIAWMYVVFIMAVVEASGAGGSLLGALITLVFYGIVPCAIVMYIAATPARRRAMRAREARQGQADRPAPSISGQPDAGGNAPADAVSAVREKS